MDPSVDRRRSLAEPKINLFWFVETLRGGHDERGRLDEEFARTRPVGDWSHRLYGWDLPGSHRECGQDQGECGQRHAFHSWISSDGGVEGPWRYRRPQVSSPCGPNRSANASRHVV